MGSSSAPLGDAERESRARVSVEALEACSASTSLMRRAAPGSGLRRRCHRARGAPAGARSSPSSRLATGASPDTLSEEWRDDAGERRRRCPG
eukprot:1599835-Lingulodinium_polyedra.AAC.1